MQTYKTLALAQDFFLMVLSTFDSLGDITAQYGCETLADIMYLQNAIADDAYIDYFGQSKIIEAVKKLPYADLWLSYIHPLEGHENQLWKEARLEQNTSNVMDGGSRSKIVIEIEEGIVQRVSSDVQLDYVIYDKDVQGADKNEITERPSLDGTSRVKVFNSKMSAAECNHAGTLVAFEAAQS